MKKFLAVLLMLAMLLCGAAFAEDTAPALTKDVVVLFTSDVHCGIDQGWGYAGVANMRNSLQADNHVVLVDDGDAIQGETIGTLTKGRKILRQKSEDFCGGAFSTALEPNTSSREMVLESSV